MQEYGFGRDVTLPEIASLQRHPYVGAAFRQQSPGFDPRSGEGAKLAGGRFNPPGSFATLYLAPSIDTVASELIRQGDRQFVGAERLLPREVFSYSLGFKEVIDLTVPDTRRRLGVDRKTLTSNDLKFTQFLGEASFGLGVQAVVSYSAANNDGLIIAVFLENLHGCNLEPEHIDSWTSLEHVQKVQP